ncbi:hypothetical protein CEXT_212171 [Caerostris extrusa]|uniref:Uncharacterized protein n=1 Tax=Caerostris extrusa TaxID=172846 RepID=A0AAV4UP28_CAEEX|nr:hypothetical protein CEXT_212171 [Caerostris extrusa]
MCYDESNGISNTIPISKMACCFASIDQQVSTSFYGKLMMNVVTLADFYPLLRTDDVLNEIKPTSFMSTIDLPGGYDQAGVDTVY